MEITIPSSLLSTSSPTPPTETINTIIQSINAFLTNTSPSLLTTLTIQITSFTFTSHSLTFIGNILHSNQTFYSFPTHQQILTYTSDDTLIESIKTSLHNNINTIPIPIEQCIILPLPSTNNNNNNSTLLLVCLHYIIVIYFSLLSKYKYNKQHTLCLYNTNTNVNELNVYKYVLTALNYSNIMCINNLETNIKAHHIFDLSGTLLVSPITKAFVFNNLYTNGIYHCISSSSKHISLNENQLTPFDIQNLLMKSISIDFINVNEIIKDIDNIGSIMNIINDINAKILLHNINEFQNETNTQIVYEHIPNTNVDNNESNNNNDNTIKVFIYDNI